MHEHSTDRATRTATPTANTAADDDEVRPRG